MSMHHWPCTINHCPPMSFVNPPALILWSQEIESTFDVNFQFLDFLRQMSNVGLEVSDFLTSDIGYEEEDDAFNLSWRRTKNVRFVDTPVTWWLRAQPLDEVEVDLCWIRLRPTVDGWQYSLDAEFNLFDSWSDFMLLSIVLLPKLEESE